MRAALEASGAGVVASFVMAGGVLTGKYDAGASGRAAGELDTRRYRAARALGRRLGELAAEHGVSSAALAIAFALGNPSVASVLFGATSAAQLTDNVSALSVDSALASSLALLVSLDPALDQESGD
jgi:aryl-alcohol dehydrogenase-like predicted oxidoreductase